MSNRFQNHCQITHCLCDQAPLIYALYTAVLSHISRYDSEQQFSSKKSRRLVLENVGRMTHQNSESKCGTCVPLSAFPEKELRDRHEE